MMAFEKTLENISGWIWGWPMILLLLGGGIFLTIKLGFFQFRYFPHMISQTLGKLCELPTTY
ncbi:sodium:alanine symporter family protein [Metalysinibacillus jejuensis]|uniref:sodium:alanine symporter family protein n=1 Tax=Metalysinibacillus jejuensis TaxID=914327 RepID=UPI000D35ED42|nr:sodium:alanine symporter family protein [Metalysinibacillus jejuensis]